ncbi:hypothetical protein BKA93DRAFT_269351 [Sparassis latifolia]
MANQLPTWRSCNCNCITVSTIVCSQLTSKNCENKHRKVREVTSKGGRMGGRTLKEFH